ncbi:AMP-binding protein [Cryobacterium sp. TMT2-23]|uniref:AMP-binding protein n=1 Tax=Cryobacterium sp. TMT2-23 TaxID=1259252 RepID=UPI001F546D98|nr:AMP-binding protein [Cryobacterium sp. TMT2-23]
MTRVLRVVPVGDPLDLMEPLRRALTNSDDAVMPVPGPDPETGAPTVPGVGVGVGVGADRDPARVPRQVAVVIETSGSTARPKRVMLSTDALLSSAAASSGRLGGPGQWLLALPAHYVAGVQVLVRSLAAGTTPVVLPAGHFDPAVFAAHADLLTDPSRFTSVVPVQLARLVTAAADDRFLRATLRRFTGILVGGQALPPGLFERARELDLNLITTYGSSETAGGCVYNGIPIGNTEVRSVAGQLEISGSVLAEGYLDDPELTRDRFVDVRGVRWYRTGDLGEVDDATGVVRVLGRMDNVIISGGEKVSLDAVERIVRALPGLGEAQVVGVDDPQWGQVPVIVRDGAAGAGTGPGADPAALARAGEAVASVLGRAARPARIVTVSAIPHLASGKPDRQALGRLLDDLRGAGEPGHERGHEPGR